MSKEESVLELLHKASRRAKNDDLARQDTASGIRYVMDDMLAMKDCVNARDIERWCKALESVLNESVLKHMGDVYDGHGVRTQR